MKVILFDFFGVLSTPVYMSVFSKYVPEHDTSRWVAMLESLDNGSISEDELVHRVSTEYHVGTSEIWSAVDNAPTVNRELIEFIKQELLPSYKVGIFSNIPRSLIERIIPNELALFSPQIISSDLGCVKPSDEIFRRAISMSGVSSEDILFIDDSPKNIEAAQRHGMQGIVYTEFTDLKAKLLNMI